MSPVPLFLYSATAAAILFVAHRYLRPLSLATALVLFLLPFCFVGRALVTGSVFGPIDLAYVSEPLLALRSEHRVAREDSAILGDVAYQMIPWRKALKWSISHGEWPLWNPFILSGDILAAAGQPAAYSPFTLLALLLPIGSGLTFSAAIAFFIAGFGAYLFARDLGHQPLASLFAAGAWMYSGALTLFILWPLGVSWTYLPLVLLGVRRVVDSPSVHSIAILSTALTLLILAGHPETVLHVVVIGSVYAIVELIARRHQIVKSVGAGIAAGAVALALCAVYLLPLLEAAPQTMEHAYRLDFIADSVRRTSAVEVAVRIATNFLPFMHTRTWKIENLPPVSPETGVVGSIVLACAIYAMVVTVRSRQTWFFAALTLFGMLVGAGWIPVMWLLKKLPLFDIALNERLVFASAFALAVLAAAGVDDLIRSQRWRLAAIIFFAVLAALAAATVIVEREDLAGANLNGWGDYQIAADIGLLAVAAALLTLPLARRAFLMAALLLSLMLAQRMASDAGIYPVYPAAAAYPPLPLLESMKKTPEPFRIAGWNLVLVPGTNALYELEDVRGYQAMTFAPYHATYPLWCHHQPVWFNKVVDLTRPFLSFLNVRYAIVPTGHEPPEGWRLFAEDKTGRVLENMRVIERVFLPRTLRIGEPSDALMEMLQQTDFREKAWIGASPPVYERQNGTGQLSVNRKGTTYYIVATMDDDGWIVISEKAWKGWRAYIDGRRVGTTIANTSFLSVFVPRGKHSVRLVYLPDSFVFGRAISIATLVGISGFLAIRAWRSRSRSVPA